MFNLSRLFTTELVRGKGFFSHTKAAAQEIRTIHCGVGFLFLVFFFLLHFLFLSLLFCLFYTRNSQKKRKWKDGLGGNAMRLMRLRFAGQTNRPSVGEATKREREKGLHSNNRLMVRFVHPFPIPGQFYLYSQREQLF